MSKKNIVDISFYPEDPFGLDKLAKDNNVIAVMDCGVAPGMGNIIFSHHDKMMKIQFYFLNIRQVDEKQIKEFEKLVEENFVETLTNDVVEGTVIHMTD